MVLRTHVIKRRKAEKVRTDEATEMVWRRRAGVLLTLGVVVSGIFRELVQRSQESGISCSDAFNGHVADTPPCRAKA
ncbi:hypothetical protein DPEC_G00146920 [Dallia pectoralis]|uniref:Uncharacterized protein n=1 Tax=Dallia pectoralis TaxID=75939 RepID=A0ACC2GPX7_DALPE|nr:hypothetical protein DPEC_G00146920 [Dallia pectoralis]